MTNHVYSVTWSGREVDLRTARLRAAAHYHDYGYTHTWPVQLPVQCLRVQNVHCGIHEQKVVLQELWR